MALLPALQSASERVSHVPDRLLHEHVHILSCMLSCSSSLRLSVQIGGLWVLNNDSGRSACYDSLRINTSKLVTCFHDFPVPKHYPMFCPHQEVGTLSVPPSKCAHALRVMQCHEPHRITALASQAHSLQSCSRLA